MEFDLLAFVLGCILGGIVGYRVSDYLHQSVILIYCAGQVSLLIDC
jgi:hypothetical protein